MTENRSIANSPAQAVVFLETLAAIVEKSLVAYSASAAEELAAHIRGMAQAVTTEAHVNPTEAIAVLFAAEHRPTFH